MKVRVGYVPLTDAAPLVVARDMGFAAEEGLDLVLDRAPSWSVLRDKLAFGQVDAAHMLSPLPVATALGLGGAGAVFHALSVLSVNGTVVGVSLDLAARLRGGGHDFAFDDAAAAGHALIAAADAPLRIGVPFPFSMHAELLIYWLSALGLPAPDGLDIRTVPPPLMAEALRAGEIDAFCVGEPWGSLAVERGVGHLLLPGAAIWAQAPEKVLAVRADRAEDEGMQGLVRAVWRAGRWLSGPGRAGVAGEMLARADILDQPVELVDRALSGNLTISPDGDQRRITHLIAFHGGAATFPWRSQAEWIGTRLATRIGLDRATARAQASAVFRSDLHRAALAPMGVDLPGASSKVEGALAEDTPVASASGHLTLRRDAFFDRRTFDPSTPDR